MSRRNKSFGSSIMRILLGTPSRSRVHARATAPRRSSRNSMKFEVDSQVAREIYAVVYLAASLLLVMSIYGGLGKVGAFIATMLRPLFGFGIHLIPVLFFGISAGLFFSKKSVFDLSRIAGIVLFMTSLLSVFHLSVPEEDLLNAAQRGDYGGYIGFVPNFIFRNLLAIGNWGAAIVFVSSLIVGLLLAFEFSIVEFLKEAKPEIRLEKRNRMRETDDGIIEVPDETDEAEDAHINIIKPVKPPLLARGDDDEDDDDQEEDDDTVSDEEVKSKRADPAIARAAMAAQNQADQKPVFGIKGEYKWDFPSLDLLENPIVADVVDDDTLKANAEVIRNKLDQFGIDVIMNDVHVGPTVIQYTLRPHEGVKLSKITGLKNDLALALAAKAIRVEAPIPGKSLVGIEIPNDKRVTVRLKEILKTPQWKEIKSQLRMPLGQSVSGQAMAVDLGAMPHILIAGATGAGKSVGMNSFLLSLLYQNSPNDLKFIMVDPKRVELNTYNGIPHLLTPVITDVEKAATSLRWAVAEMNRRYGVLAEAGHRNIADYNSDDTMEVKLPKIIIVIDELADLMMAAGKEVEASICRIAQMARAVGMHLMLATQRPSVDVITGLIKANIPARIAYAVTSGIDSRTILDCIGAEDLLGQGDMLFTSGTMSKPVRIQGVYVSSKEIERVTNRIKLTREPEYDESITSSEIARANVAGLPPTKGGSNGGNDPLYENALAVVVDSRKASASLLQRRLEIGYARAARILDEMEANGVIGPVRGAKAREIYVSEAAAADSHSSPASAPAAPAPAWREEASRQRSAEAASFAGSFGSGSSDDEIEME